MTARQMSAILAAAGLVLSAASARAAVVAIGKTDFSGTASLIDFVGTPTGAINGRTIDGVLFGFTVGGTASSDATVTSNGPGSTNNLAAPYIEGNAQGIVSLTFPQPQNRFGFGFALSNGPSPLSNATTIGLFDAGNQLLGSLSFSSVLDPTFTGGFAGIQSDLPFTRAQVSFYSASARFAADKLRFEATALPPPPPPPPPGPKVELIANGDFESGTLASWTALVKTNNTANWSAARPGTTTPLSSHATQGNAAGGAWYAVSDQSNPSALALLQTFTVPAGATKTTLAFDMFVNDWDGGPAVDPSGLNYQASGKNQHARVDILRAGADPWDTGSGVLANYYLSVDAGADPNAFHSYSFDITSVVGAGGDYQLRFAQANNQFYLNMGVDNVSVTAETVPEPSAVVLLGMGAVGLLALIRRRRR